MAVSNSEYIWTSIRMLAESLQKAYSVTGKETIRKQYLKQVAQYPLYLKWFEKIINHLDKEKKPINVLEYGPGPGLLAKKLISHPKVNKYTAVEPEKIFREMTYEADIPSNSIIESTAEDYVNPSHYDYIVATATYHHFNDKPLALKKIFSNLKAGGKLIVADVFLPNYDYDENYNPVDKIKFVEKIMEYSAAQIIAMPNPKVPDVIDQIKTAFLDILIIEELKVCIPIIKEQLRKTGFKNINCEFMRDNRMDHSSLGYYFIVANKGEQNAT